MKIIVCALDCEIKPLKKYFNNKIKIFNCGVKAKKLNFINSLGPNDHLINIGICGGKQVGEIFLCNKIIGDKTYYPDNFYPSNLKEKELITTNILADKNIINKHPNSLFDQEAAIICHAAQKHIGPHQISFIKIVSDDGTKTKELSKKDISILVEKHIPKIENFIIENRNEKRHTNKDISKYSKKLQASITMENRLNQLICYAKICNVDIDKYFNNSNKINNKKEAIKFLDDFENFLIYQ